MSSAPGCAPDAVTGASSAASTRSRSTSSGSASTTGPGRPDSATWNARATYSGMRRASAISAAHFASPPNIWP